MGGRGEDVWRKGGRQGGGRNGEGGYGDMVVEKMAIAVRITDVRISQRFGPGVIREFFELVSQRTQ